MRSVYREENRLRINETSEIIQTTALLLVDVTLAS